MKATQKELILRLHELLLEINEEAINDENFYNWLNNNYFFEKNMEEVIIKVKKSINNI